MSYYCDDAYDVYDEQYVTARKTHCCYACKETIGLGHRYCRIGVVYDGTARTIKRCLRCQTLHEHLRTLGDYDQWPDERLNCGLSYADEWGEVPANIVELAFLSGADLQGETNG